MYIGNFVWCEKFRLPMPPCFPQFKPLAEMRTNYEQFGAEVYEKIKINEPNSAKFTGSQYKKNVHIQTPKHNLIHNTINYN